MNKADFRKNQSGAALMTVLVAIMIITLILFEFQYEAIVERKLAYNDLNQIQANYLAKSGVRLGLLRIALYGRLKRSPELKNLDKTGAMGPYLDKIWQLPLPPFPPKESSLKKLAKADKDAAEKALEQTKITDGEYSYVISGEGSKINLNYLVVPQQSAGNRIDLRAQPKTLFEYVAHLLLNLIDNFLKQSEKPYDEYPDLRPEEFVFRVMDWVNPGTNSFTGGDKDGFYQRQKPPYRTKKNRFYTLEELKLVEGVDDHLYNKLRPYVTVYSYDGRINLNNATKEIYRALYPDFTEDDLTRILAEKNRIGDWPNEDTFVRFVSDSLGRGGFKTLYADPNNYPFTVGTQSFLIEAMGNVKKSKSSVQKIIRVGVALTQARVKGGKIVGDIKEETKCNATPGLYWRKQAQVCVGKPQNQSECQIAGGTWTDQNGKFGCFFNQEGFVFPDNPGGTGAAGGKTKAPDPNAMKILFWTET